MAEQLWAPWRLAYIEGATGEPTGEECLFEWLPALGDDRKALILHRGALAFVMLNAYPYTNGHLMVAPYRHTSSLDELDDAELLEIQQLVRRATAWVTHCYHPDGFNIGLNMGSAAGAGIPRHLHWHIVPRWQGDTNFMTTIGEVRVLPQDLWESYDRLKACVK